MCTLSSLTSPRKAIIALIALLGVVCACIASPDVGHAKSPHHDAAYARGGTHLYVLLGLGNNSPGLAEFGDQMQRAGIRTTVANHGYESLLAQESIAEYRSGRVSSIKIIGHSLGGSAAARMAAELGEAGVPVQLLVTLDPVGEASPSSNVRRYANFVPRVGEDHFTMIAGRMRELYAYVLGR